MKGKAGIRRRAQGPACARPHPPGGLPLAAGGARRPTSSLDVTGFPPCEIGAKSHSSKFAPSKRDLMEIAMLEQRTNSPRLCPKQWERRRQGMIRRAFEARAVRDQVRRLGPPLRSMAESGRDAANSLVSRTLVIAGRWIKRYADWRNRRQAVRELAALDDRALKDFGIHRSEIESVVDGRDLKPRAECEVPAALFHQPYDRPITGPRPVTKQPRSWPHCDRGGGGRRIFRGSRAVEDSLRCQSKGR